MRGPLGIIKTDRAAAAKRSAPEVSHSYWTILTAGCRQRLVCFWSQDHHRHKDDDQAHHKSQDFCPAPVFHSHHPPLYKGVANRLSATDALPDCSGSCIIREAVDLCQLFRIQFCLGGFPFSLFIPAQILRRCRLTYFFPLLPPDPLSDPYPDPEPVTSQWNSHLYVGYVLRKPPANTPKNGLTGLFVMPNHRS